MASMSIGSQYGLFEFLSCGGSHSDVVKIALLHVQHRRCGGSLSHRVINLQKHLMLLCVQFNITFRPSTVKGLVIGIVVSLSCFHLQ